MELYWYKMNDDFYKFNNGDSVLVEVVKSGDDIYIVTREEATEYYKELGLSYVGCEKFDVE